MSSNDAALAALDRLRERIVEIGEIAEAVAPEVARSIKGIVDADIAAGRSPGGEAWQPTKKGEKPLQKAAAAVSAHADGTRVVVSVTGPEALHHLGWARGGVVRQILPYREQLDPWIKAVETVVAKHVATKGGG